MNQGRGLLGLEIFRGVKAPRPLGKQGSLGARVYQGSDLGLSGESPAPVAWKPPGASTPMTSHPTLIIKHALSAIMASNQHADCATHADAGNITSHSLLEFTAAKAFRSVPAWWEGAVPLVAMSVDVVRLD